VWFLAVAHVINEARLSLTTGLETGLLLSGILLKVTDAARERESQTEPKYQHYD